jgi:hypothetical protein
VEIHGRPAEAKRFDETLAGVSLDPRYENAKAILLHHRTLHPHERRDRLSPFGPHLLSLFPEAALDCGSRVTAGVQKHL